MSNSDAPPPPNALFFFFFLTFSIGASKRSPPNSALFELSSVNRIKKFYYSLSKSFLRRDKPSLKSSKFFITLSGFKFNGLCLFK